jgi:glyoxylase-like metal-dependent hydrolase (beta-lactamase superfamily II)
MAMATDLPIDTQWFLREQMDPVITKFWEPHVKRLSRSNTYFVKGRDRDLLFDSGMGVGDLKAAVADLIDKPIITFLSHTHSDHVGSAHQFPDEVLIHPSEAERLRTPPAASLLFDKNSSSLERRAWLRTQGFDMDGWRIDAIPFGGYDPATWSIKPVQPTRLVDEGDIVDLGDRQFEVLHMPGHTFGSISLFEHSTGILLGGDAIYDGVLLDNGPESNIPDYIKTMKRCRELPVTVVHGGHRASFGRRRLHEIIDGYLAKRDAAAA